MRKLLILLFLITALGAISGTLTRAESSVKTVETSSDGRVSVQARQVGEHIFETLSIKYGHQVYRVPDERVHADEGSPGYFNDDVDELYDHEFFFSPDSKWLFVTRKCMHSVGVGYLYHLTSRGFVPVHPFGLRFDEAAMRFCARREHFAIPTLMSGGRIARFQRWAAQGKQLFFELDAAKNYAGHWVAVIGAYDLASGRFSILSFQKD
jgi:hypothetical protein